MIPLSGLIRDTKGGGWGWGVCRLVGRVVGYCMCHLVPLLHRHELAAIINSLAEVKQILQQDVLTMEMFSVALSSPLMPNPPATANIDGQVKNICSEIDPLITSFTANFI